MKKTFLVLFLALSLTSAAYRFGSSGEAFVFETTGISNGRLLRLRFSITGTSVMSAITTSAAPDWSANITSRRLVARMR